MQVCALFSELVRASEAAHTTLVFDKPSFWYLPLVLFVC